ncbi:hypothetical protein SCWH03_31640 [Streptomyces pacificus]|uniref:Uncharacterized protein n=1 Tax=Streptomyces pacificus TaxID=2705029 RepID=A0A6A0AX60_9ACTN|nr:hypothetical protein SCWH03_31640 [Streptomyces pacificus]
MVNATAAPRPEGLPATPGHRGRESQPGPKGAVTAAVTAVSRGIIPFRIMVVA